MDWQRLTDEERRIGDRAYRVAVGAAVPREHPGFAQTVLLVAGDPRSVGKTDAQLLTAVRSHLANRKGRRPVSRAAPGTASLPAVVPDYQRAMQSLDDPRCSDAAQFEAWDERVADAAATVDCIEASVDHLSPDDARCMAIMQELGDATALAAAAIDIHSRDRRPDVRGRPVRASRHARLFYKANATLMWKTAELFYRELKRTFSSSNSIRQVGAALIDQEPRLRAAALLVAGAVPRFVLRLAPGGGHRRRRTIGAPQIVQPDVRYGGRSFTDLHQERGEGGLQRGAVLKLWPRRRPCRSVRRHCPTGLLSIRELLRQADTRAEALDAAAPTGCASVVFDLVDDAFTSVLYDASGSGGPGRAGAAFAGAIVGRRAEMVRRLHLPREDVSPWSTFTLPLRLRAAMGVENDPLWGVALRKVTQHVGWFHSLSANTHEFTRRQ